MPAFKDSGPAPGSFSKVTVSPRSGEPFGTGEVGLWLPEDVPAARGAFFGTQMPGQPLGANTMRIDDWRTARAARVDFGLLFTRFTQRDGDPRRPGDRCDLTWPALQRGLDALARQTGHPEIRTMPFVVEGSSAGGACTDNLIAVVPERIVALDLVGTGMPARCDTPKVAGIPTVLREGSVTGGAAARDLARCRKAGMPVAVVLQQSRSARDLVRTSWVDKNFVDAVLVRRVPAQVGDALLPVDLEDGLLADNRTGGRVSYSAAPAAVDRSWLPSPCVARAWDVFRAKPPSRAVQVRYTCCG